MVQGFNVRIKNELTAMHSEHTLTVINNFLRGGAGFMNKLGPKLGSPAKFTTIIT